MLCEEVLWNKSFTEYNLQLGLLFALRGAVTYLWRERFSTVKVRDSLWSLVELSWCVVYLSTFLISARWWCYDKLIGERTWEKSNFKCSCNPPGLMWLQKLRLAENHLQCWLLRGLVYTELKDTVLVRLTVWTVWFKASALHEFFLWQFAVTSLPLNCHKKHLRILYWIIQLHLL